MAACRNPTKLLPQYKGEVRQGDLRDADYLDRVLAGIDIICHAAGWSSFENASDRCNKAYLEPTLDLINHANEWRISRFINLSSIYASATTQRNNANIKGKPCRNFPMINCHIAVEDYLRNLDQPRCQFVNLRLGLYAGKRLNMGLLPLLLSRNNQAFLPYLSGSLGHLPLVDGRDIGQAFARAALGPFEPSYNSLNIVGPDCPSHAQVMAFIKEQRLTPPLTTGLPSFVASPILWLQGKSHKINDQPLLTAAMLNMLKSPPIDNAQAAQLIGYDPQISWQASLLDTLESYKNQSFSKEISQAYRDLNI